LTKFLYRISNVGDCAVIIAAHPRKQSQDSRRKPSLVKSRDDFFDEVMGSSHLVNSTGSLWGIEKTQDGYSHFLGGTQRLTGTSSVSMIEMDHEGWFHLLGDVAGNFALVVHTPKRKAAWELLPKERTFTHSEAEELCKPALSSSDGFNGFWNDIKRLNLIEPKDGGYMVVKVAGAAKKPPDQPINKTKDSTLEATAVTEPIPDQQTETTNPLLVKPDHPETGPVPS
jgi:hypothetical protein